MLSCFKKYATQLYTQSMKTPAVSALEKLTSAFYDQKIKFTYTAPVILNLINAKSLFF